MKSYMFEFYAEYFGEAVHCFILNSDISEEQINDFFERLIQIRRPNFEEILKDFLNKRKIEYSNFMYIKKDFSYDDIEHRTSDVIFDFSESSKYDYHYILYLNSGRWIAEDFYWKIALIAKKVENSFKVIFQTDKYDDYDNFGTFSIYDNDKKIFSKHHLSDDKNDEPVIRCNSNELFNMLIHIDEIKNDIDAKKFCIKKRR